MSLNMAAEMWCLDREYTKIKSEIDHCNSEKAALDKAKTDNEIQCTVGKIQRCKVVECQEHNERPSYNSNTEGHLGSATADV